MLSWIAAIVRSVLTWIVEAIAFPFRLLGLGLGGPPIPPPPLPPVPEPEPIDLPDPSRRWAREVLRWARRRVQGTAYEPDVPQVVRDWLDGLDTRRTSRLAALTVPDIQRLLTAGATSPPPQSTESSSASAADRSRSARNARERQYSAADIQSHSRL